MKSHHQNAGHMTKLAAMPIYGKNTLKNLLSRNHVPILMNLCMKHQRPSPLLFVKIMSQWADYHETLYEALET